MNINDLFRTSDLALSAALVALGFCLEAVEKEYPKSTFIFKRSEALDEAIQGFWASSLRIEPKTYFNSVKEVKSRLYSQD
jgi:hypothetical protein